MAHKERPEVRGRPHVALIVETSLASGRAILRGIARYVREHGPWSVYHEPRSLEESVPAWLRKWRGDGIIARLQHNRITAAILETGLPAVDVLGVAPDARIPLVHVDDAQNARLAAEHLLERGFTHFGCCGLRGANWSQHRRDEFVRTVAVAGCQCNVYHLPVRTPTEWSWETEQERLAKWVESLPKPAGVLACSDPQGQRVLEACRRAGVSVPEEVAVIGVDNDRTMCEVCDPPLSSVAANHERVGYEAARLIDQLMHGQPAPKDPIHVNPAGVVTRQSTDALAVHDRELARAVRFIREHACDGISVQDVVENVLLTRRQLGRRFRNMFGCAIHDEIVRVRIKRVKELLAETDMPLRLIAQKIGFRHQEYMSVVFKAKVGKTPSQYRKQVQR